MEHAELPADGAQIHVPHNWEYADAAARTAATGFVLLDLYKLALQLDDLSLWQLTDIAPLWQQVGASAATTSTPGSVQLATTAEAGTGTNATKAVVPSGLFPAEADVASGGTTNIGAATTSKVRITGTTTITAFDTVAAGITRSGRFAGILTLTHNGTSLILPGAANITTAAGDTFMAMSLGSGNWYVLFYSRADGAPIGKTAITPGAYTAANITVDAYGRITVIANGSGGGTKTLVRFTPSDNQPPSSTYATWATRNAIEVLEFDSAANESAIFLGIIPEAADFTTGLKVRIFWAAATATAGDCVWNASFERMTTDMDTDSFASAQASTTTTNGTSGVPNVTEISFTGSQIDGLLAGEMFRLKLLRNSTDNTMTGDAQVIAIEIRQL